MLNYIKAELWKVLHRRGVYVLLALLLPVSYTHLRAHET